MTSPSTPPYKYSVPHRKFSWDWQGILELFFFIGGWFIFAQLTPNSLWQEGITFNAVIFIGAIGVWRYSWWLINLSRSVYFGKIRYPKMRKEADELWYSGIRPDKVHFLMTTYHEVEETTFLYLDALLRELRRDGLNGVLWVGYGAVEDERVIRKWLRRQPDDIPLELVMVKQNLPGKRMAIGVILRALARYGVGENDVAFLMDGDAILTDGSLQKSISLFTADPELMALTTDEDAIVMGPSWVQKWLTMRFAQRRFWMQSHAMSKRVLTLTGRMSAYRASRVVDPVFIRTVEADHLSHWLWGQFRFLSGDDKSTWYTLLKQGGNMTYCPDVMVYTIEYIEGWGIIRMRDNLIRWSGNMLRNGMRAIMLGPRKVPFFIWWCLIDQRVSIWTVMAGFTAMLSITLFVNGDFFYTYLLWIMLTRFLMSCVLFAFSDRIRFSYPFILYANQLLSAFIKVYIMFRLPKQRWANRKAQKGGDDVMASRWKRLMADYVNLLYVSTMIFIVMLITGVIYWPSYYQL